MRKEGEEREEKEIIFYWPEEEEHWKREIWGCVKRCTLRKSDEAGLCCTAIEPNPARQACHAAVLRLVLEVNLDLLPSLSFFFSFLWPHKRQGINDAVQEHAESVDSDQPYPR